MNLDLPTSADVVFVDTLHVSANIGPDCWGKEREQPIEITVYLHLQASYLDTAGHSDNVFDSVHYGHLTKTVSALIKSKSSDGFNGVDDLVNAVSERAFEMGGDAISEVRVVVGLPKMVLLAAGGLSVDVTTVKGEGGGPNTVVSKKVSVKDLVLPVIIGVNPPEREEKQRVVINIIFYEDVRLNIELGPSPDYQQMMSQLSKEIEPTLYLTLEKFVMEIVRSACLASPKLAAITARAQKPSALSFAQSSGVEITRRRADFLQRNGELA